MIALLLAACSTPTPFTERLEAFEATDDRSEFGESVEHAGAAAVSGAERDWTLVVGPEEDRVTLGIHSPGGSDLSTLDGRDVELEVGSAWGDATRNLAISDADGAAYLVQFTEGGPASDAFGQGFASFGDELAAGGIESDYGRFDVLYRVALFQTDDGVVEALPGEPFEAVLDGDTWRIVVHASFEVTDSPDTMPACGGGIDTTLSFEMLRVASAAELAPLAPLDGVRLAGESSCG